ncbi:adenosine deaminase [Pseudonocardia sp. CA-107938]|uniref:adenosine deaminase n=1 Tax=Pseudonocardia sp. CA-107938 TaxID=3240021 RepID=UPI003D8B3631
MPTTDVAAFTAALPKVELHLHLVGSASLDTVLTLARRHPERGVPTDRDELRRFYAFRDFPHFLDVYFAVNRLVTTGADVVTLLDGAAAELATRNVRYAEIQVTPVRNLGSGISFDDLAQALADGRELAAAKHGVELGWIFDGDTALGLPGLEQTLEFAVQHRPPGTVGLGLGGAEIGVRRADYAPLFARARDAGLHCLPHAGETVGPEEVWAAVRDLGAERVGHGIGAATDPALLDVLAERGITLEVCPMSNVRTAAVPSLAEHPLPRIVAAGVPVTLATDDPGMFDTDLDTEYRVAHEVLGLSPAQLADIARAGARAAFCSPQLRAELLTGIDEVCAAHGV